MECKGKQLRGIQFKFIDVYRLSQQVVVSAPA